MKILHLATFLQGGAGRVITDLAIEQRRAGHDVRVVVSDSSPSGYGNYPAYLDRLALAGIPVRLVDSMFARRHAANLAVVHVIEELYHAGDEPDVIHTHASIPSLVALLFIGARRSTTRIVQTMHGWGMAKDAEQTASDVSLMNLVDRVIVPSRESFDTLVSLGVAPGRIAHVPYGVGQDRATSDRRDRALVVEMERRRKDGALVIAMVGTVGSRKRQTLAAEAAAGMLGAAPFLVFVGDGDTAELDAVVDHLRLGDRVRLHGYSNAARLIAKHADVLVLPSESEGQPLAVLEAFADGTLVVVSDIPELTELVEDGVTGFQCVSGRAESLAAVLDGVAGMTPAVRRTVAEQARRRYVREFTLSAMVDGYSVHYRGAPREAMSRRRRKAAPAA